MSGMGCWLSSTYLAEQNAQLHLCGPALYMDDILPLASSQKSRPATTVAETEIAASEV